MSPSEAQAQPNRLTAERLFTRYFLPLYPPELRQDLGRVRTTDANPAGNPAITGQLDEIAEVFARRAPELLAAPGLDLDYSDASVHHLSALLTRERRDALATPVTEAGQLPPLVHLVTHGAAYVGACVVRQHQGRWQVRSPLWESLVELDSRAGSGSLAIFQWWLKSLSDDEIDEPRLADRYRMHVELPTMAPEQLPVIAAPDRKLPRLKKARYDTLYQHLSKHLPELASVGQHFPSPERFAELGFHWLDFSLLGAGRMLLLHGPTDAGVHLFWLDASGFRSALFFPADAVPEHRVVQEEDKLIIEVPMLGSVQRHEMLWWGS